MAKDKKGFLMYADQVAIVRKLVQKDRDKGTNNAGELFLHILEYVNDENPTPLNEIIELVFEPIKQQLKRDLVSYEIIKSKRSDYGKEGGKKSGETRRKQKEANEANASKSKQKEANEAVSVNGNDNVNDIKGESAPPKPISKPIITNLSADKHIQEIKNSPERKNNLYRQLKGKFPDATEKHFFIMLDGFAGKFDEKHQNGETRRAFGLEWGWFVSDQKKLPEQAKNIVTNQTPTNQPKPLKLT